MMFKVVMKFAKKCPRCGGNVQTKSIKKSIGLGFVDIPVAQFCLDPTCDWYQDFSESRNPGDIKEDMIHLKIPRINAFHNFPVKNTAVLGSIMAVLAILFVLGSMPQQPQLLKPEGPGGPEVTSAPSVNTTKTYTQSPTPVQSVTKGQKNYSIKIDVAHGFKPDVLVINRSDIVFWNNEENQRPRVVLKSREGLFENKLLEYSDKYPYQFNLSGNYTFSLAEYPTFKVYPNTTGRIIVK